MENLSETYPVSALPQRLNKQSSIPLPYQPRALMGKRAHTGARQVDMEPALAPICGPGKAHTTSCVAMGKLLTALFQLPHLLKKTTGTGFTTKGRGVLLLSMLSQARWYTPLIPAHLIQLFIYFMPVCLSIRMCTTCVREPGKIKRGTGFPGTELQMVDHRVVLETGPGSSAGARAATPGILLL